MGVGSHLWTGEGSRRGDCYQCGLPPRAAAPREPCAESPRWRPVEVWPAPVSS